MKGLLRRLEELLAKVHILCLKMRTHLRQPPEQPDMEALISLKSPSNKYDIVRAQARESQIVTKAIKRVSKQTLTMTSKKRRSLTMCTSSLSRKEAASFR